MTEQRALAPAFERSLPKHVPELDGVRGLAILMVFVGQRRAIRIEVLRLDWPVGRFFARNGGVGVDLFFVLSGFLITGTLYDAKGSRHYFKTSTRDVL
ncbi:MAG: acyltransferase family protein [Gemmatimonadales bacterium]